MDDESEDAARSGTDEPNNQSRGRGRGREPDNDVLGGNSRQAEDVDPALILDGRVFYSVLAALTALSLVVGLSHWSGG